MTDVVPHGGSAMADFPNRQIQPHSGMNVGAVSIEQERAIAEAQGQMILAKRFPRSMAAAMAEMMEACKSKDFATAAFYSVPNRGSGPSIRFAEEVARCYGNFQYGHRELSRTEGKSEVQVYAWDMERNNRSTRDITILHVLDSKNGSRPLKDQADIDNRIANVASKQIRGRILALMPKSLVEAAIAECKKTLAGGSEKPLVQRIKDITDAFGKFNVGVSHLEAHLGHKLDQITIDEIADLQGIFNALREGGKASEFFPMGHDPATGEVNDDGGTGGKIKAAARKTPEKKPDQKPAEEPKADPKPDDKPKPPREVEKKPSEAESRPVEPPPPAEPTGDPRDADDGPPPPADDDDDHGGNDGPPPQAETIPESVF